MCRLLAWAARDARTCAEALGAEDLDGFTELSRQHADGWGTAWYPPDEDAADHPPTIKRSTRCAADDPRFAELTLGARSDAGFVHLRWATPGLPVVIANTHPFVHGQLAFAHNGAIHPQGRLDDILPAGWRTQMHGTTDSERYFLAVAARLAEGASVLESVGDVVRRIFADFEPTSLNAMLLAPDALYVISAHDPARVPPMGASSGGTSSSTQPDTGFYDLHLRMRGDSMVVASSGFAQPAEEGWEPLESMALLRIERGTLRTSVDSLTPATVPLPR
ncbi:MAG TPA: class II glutamine amidotransferase [Candidatus Dormibacteraeota bacterium]|jgi:predicted glutamine amidotransferase|nr:class II glutamine amidotransferase [Candidatus Dormibacteraeota bacterium]